MLLTGLSVVTTEAYEDGAPPGYTGGFDEDDCSACHSDNRRNHRHGYLQINGLPDTVSAGEEYTISVTLAHEALQSAGLQLSLRHANGGNAGQVQTDDPTLAEVTLAAVRYLQQHAAKEATEKSGKVSWEFRWRAPAAGDRIVLNVAANAANGDRSALGDFVYVSVAETTVLDTTD